MSNALSIFRSNKGETAYLTAYDDMLSHWPVPYESVHIQGRFGSTHILVAGPEDAPPLVILPAVTNSASSWFKNVAGLSQHHRIYIVDPIGDSGKSVLTRKFTNKVHIAEWLSGVFDELKLDAPAVAGHSYGGWLALNLAFHAPEQVSKLILIAPAASLQQFHWFVQLGLQVPYWFPLQLDAKTILESMVAKGYTLNETYVELMRAVSKHTKQHLLFPTVFSDEELRQVKVSTLLLYGEQEVIYDPKAAIERAKRLFPNITTVLIPNASHLVIMEQTEMVNSRILAFLEANHIQGRVVSNTLPDLIW